VEQLEQFKRDHLSQPEPPPPEPPPTRSPEPEARDADEEEEIDEPAAPDEGDAPEPATAAADGAERPHRRRRGRRGGRGRSGARPAASYEGTFDHGAEGYGLWLDPAVAESQVYIDNWAGHRAVKVTVDADSITIRRSGDNGAEEPEEED
jgi:hypothetical protein